MVFKCVRTDAELEVPLVDAALRKLGDLVILPDSASEADVIGAVADADVLLMCYTPITKAIIQAAPQLKGIVKYGVGIDAIDMDAARDAGVPVVNIPLYAEETVAEGAFMLMIALAKKLRPIHAEMQSKGWAWPTQSMMGLDLAGKTLGLVGCGKIGSSMARMAGAGFRMRVIAYDPHADAEALKAKGVEKVETLAEVMSSSDFVSVHCVLNAQTRGLVTREHLAQMQRHAFLINVSRGALVDEAALVEALQAGQIAGAGLDVYSQEPLAREGHPQSPLYAMDNVLLFPHLTFYTKEAMERLEDETIAHVVDLHAGRRLKVRSHDPRLRAQTTVDFVPDGKQGME